MCHNKTESRIVKYTKSRALAPNQKNVSFHLPPFSALQWLSAIFCIIYHYSNKDRVEVKWF